VIVLGRSVRLEQRMVAPRFAVVIVPVIVPPVARPL